MLALLAVICVAAFVSWTAYEQRRAVDAAREQMEVAKSAERPSAAPPPAPEPIPSPPEPTASPPRAQPLRDFPWPPPRPSAWAEIPNDLLIAGAAAPTFGDVYVRLGRALDAAGYFQRSVLGAPHGFALITQLERIDDDGTPAGSGRWQVTEDSTAFSLLRYVQRLLYAEPGRYRVVVLVVSDEPFSAATQTTATPKQLQSLMGDGLNTLPAALARESYSKEHVTTALIYEFRKVPKGEPEFVAPSALQGRDHLVQARIWAALSGAQKN